MDGKEAQRKYYKELVTQLKVFIENQKERVRKLRKIIPKIDDINLKNFHKNTLKEVRKELRVHKVCLKKAEEKLDEMEKE